MIKNQNKLKVVPFSRKYGKTKPKRATPTVVQINQIRRPTISIYLPEIAIVMANEIALTVPPLRNRIELIKQLQSHLALRMGG